jgi:hypothetical protein
MPYQTLYTMDNNNELVSSSQEDFENTLKAMKLSELVKFLENMGLDIEGCDTKEELIAAYKQNAASKEEMGLQLNQVLREELGNYNDKKKPLIEHLKDVLDFFEQLPPEDKSHIFRVSPIIPTCTTRS